MKIIEFLITIAPMVFQMWKEYREGRLDRHAIKAIERHRHLLERMKDHETDDITRTLNDLIDRLRFKKGVHITKR